MIVPAFCTFVAIVALADWRGPGHDWGGLAALTGWFFLCRTLSPRGWRWLFVAAMILSVAVAALAVAQVILWMPRARGPFASPNFLGAYAVLMFFLAWHAGVAQLVEQGSCKPQVARSNRGRWLHGIIIANLLSVALSQSRGALMALGAGLIVIAWSCRRLRLAASLTTIAALAAIPFIRPGTTDPRMEIWSLGWQAAQQRLLLGWGQGGVAIGGLDSFYSIPLEWLLASGILGVAAGAWLLAEAALAAQRHKQPNEVANRRETRETQEGNEHAKGHIDMPVDGHAPLAFLAAWFVQGLVLFGHPATYIPLVAVLAYLAGRPRPIKSHASPLPRGSHGIS